MKWNRWLTAWLTACVFAAVATIFAAESNAGISATAAIASRGSASALRGNRSIGEGVVAGCTGIWVPTAHSTSFLQTASVHLRPGSSNLGRTSYSVAASANDESADMSIVGFWKFRFTAEGNATVPDGTTVDDGFVQWHSDGTEIMNSLRPPVTTNFCLGVWKKTGGRSYTLNHFALSWDPNNNFVGPANIREDVSVGQGGQSYAGTFTIDQFDQSGNVLAHVTGNVTGTRITVDTTPADVR